MLPVRAFPGTKKAAVAAEPAKSPAAQEPTEKPASATFADVQCFW